MKILQKTQRIAQDVTDMIHRPDQKVYRTYDRCEAVLMYGSLKRNTAYTCQPHSTHFLSRTFALTAARDTTPSRSLLLVVKRGQSTQRSSTTARPEGNSNRSVLHLTIRTRRLRLLQSSAYSCISHWWSC